MTDEREAFEKFFPAASANWLARSNQYSGKYADLWEGWQSRGETPDAVPEPVAWVSGLPQETEAPAGWGLIDPNGKLEYDLIGSKADCEYWSAAEGEAQSGYRVVPVYVGAPPQGAEATAQPADSYSQERGARTIGPVGGLRPQMPSPSAFDLVDPLFNAIWDVTKTWDANAPEYYIGYCGLNGSHVMLILNAIRASLPEATALPVQGASAAPQAPALSPSEAIYAFAGWLTTRPGSLVAGETHGAAEWADAVERFRLAQGWAEPRPNYADRIKRYSHATPEARTLPDWRLDELAGALYLCITDGVYAQTVSASNRVAEINTLVCNALRAAGYDTTKARPTKHAEERDAA